MRRRHFLHTAPSRAPILCEGSQAVGRHARVCLFSGRLSGASERSAAPESGPSYRPRSARQEKLFRLLLHSMFILRGGRQRCCTAEDGVHSTRTARCVVRRPCPVGTAFVHHSTSIRNRAPTPTVQAPSTSPRVPHAVQCEARSPSTAGGKESTPITVELAQRMANAALVAMRDAKRASADKLSSQQGINAASAAKSTRIHEATACKGAHVNNGRVESHFGKADHLMSVLRSYCWSGFS